MLYIVESKWYRRLGIFLPLKIFGTSLYALLAGKEAMTDNPGRFNKEASESFRNLTCQQKDQLLLQGEKEAPTRRLTRKEALHQGEKIFKRIQHLVSKH